MQKELQWYFLAPQSCIGLKATWANLVPHKYLTTSVLIAALNCRENILQHMLIFECVCSTASDHKQQPWASSWVAGRKLFFAAVYIFLRAPLNPAIYPLPLSHRKLNFVLHPWVCGVFPFPLRLQTLEGPENKLCNCSLISLNQAVNSGELRAYMWVGSRENYKCIAQVALLHQTIVYTVLSLNFTNMINL